LPLAFSLVSLGAVTFWVKDNAHSVGLAFAAISATTAALKFYADMMRSWREDAAKRMAGEKESEYRRWAEQKVDLIRSIGHPLRVEKQDRGYLDWAVRNRRLRVVEECEWGWRVIEETRLGD
jgi:hypothetical protein